jgi:PAS domain S-box-containing protein
MIEDADRFSALRMRAEQIIADTPHEMVNVSLDQAKELVHELRVNQVELEMQNDELRKIQSELNLLHHKYMDLYESSPVGLVIIDHEGRIQDPNLRFIAMLGVPRYKLIKWTLTTFISYESQDTYYMFYRALLNTHLPQQCEIVLLSMTQQNLIYVRLDGAAIVQSGMPTSYRIAFTDITSQKHVEIQKLELKQQRERIVALLKLLNTK